MYMSVVFGDSNGVLFGRCPISGCPDKGTYMYILLHGNQSLQRFMNDLSTVWEGCVSNDDVYVV